MDYVTGTDSRQMTIGVWNIEDEVPQDSPARFIEVYVNSLDPEAMALRTLSPRPRAGRPAINPRYPLQQIPDVEQPDRYNSFGKLKRDNKRITVFIKRYIPKQKLRRQAGKHPFGTIKHDDDGRYFLCKGKEKVTAEFALSVLACDIRRAINICGGIQKLIERCRRLALPKIRKIAES